MHYLYNASKMGWHILSMLFQETGNETKGCKWLEKLGEKKNMILDEIIKERKEKIEHKLNQIKNLQAQIDEEIKELQYFLEKKECRPLSF